MSQQYSPNPAWLSWFDRIDSETAIRDSAYSTASIVENLASMSLEEGCSKLDAAWREIFVPGDNHVKILKTLVDVAKGYSKSIYPTWVDYNMQRNDEVKPAADMLPIRCLTGLAGVSKSSLMSALERICRVGPTDKFAAGGQIFPIYPVRRIKIHAQVSPRSVLICLANPIAIEGRLGMDQNSLYLHVRDWLLATGTAVLVVDEMQFLTTSSTASTKISQLILLLGTLGFPLVYVANYSLVNKFLLRPQEEKDRLLGHPMLLDPPHVDSPQWQQVVTEYLRVAPEQFRINVGDAQELHRLTAGLFRGLRQLLLQAYRISVAGGRPFVTMNEVREAYRSGEFSTYRRDVEDLASLPVSRLIEGRRPDLVCPFAPIQRAGPRETSRQIPPSTTLNIDLPAALLESSLHADAQGALKELRRVASEAKAKGKGKASVTKLPRRTQVSARSLQDGARLLRGELSKKSKESTDNTPQPSKSDEYSDNGSSG